MVAKIMGVFAAGPAPRASVAKTKVPASRRCLRLLPLLGIAVVASRIAEGPCGLGARAPAAPHRVFGALAVGTYPFSTGGRGSLAAGSALRGGCGALRQSVSRRFKVVLETPDGEQSFDCPGGTTILDQAEDLGLELPYSCRTGDCSICAGKVLEGEIDQSEQKFLTEEQIAGSYCLTCVTKPMSDVRIKTNVDSDVSPVKVTQEDIDDAMNLGIFDDSDAGGGYEL
mmetsp:Transcript_30151/g.82870  ORF Transcript_30151/g.82870 Transcript_30151/m.82870 type:complete len:227 (+) Transcript_30151:67-747(+)